MVGVSHPVLLSVKDKQGRSRGFLRVETFWLDEAKPRKETGEFYYKVCLCMYVCHVIHVVSCTMALLLQVCAFLSLFPGMWKNTWDCFTM